MKSFAKTRFFTSLYKTKITVFFFNEREIEKEKNYDSYQGCFAVYDHTNRESFEGIEEWFGIMRKLNGNIPMFLVANKCDLKTEGGVSEEEAMKLAKDNKAEFFEVSGEKGTNINLMLETMVTKAVENQIERYHYYSKGKEYYLGLLEKDTEKNSKSIERVEREERVNNDNVLMEMEDFENEEDFQEAPKTKNTEENSEDSKKNFTIKDQENNFGKEGRNDGYYCY